MLMIAALSSAGVGAGAVWPEKPPNSVEDDPVENVVQSSTVVEDFRRAGGSLMVTSPMLSRSTSGSTGLGAGAATAVAGALNGFICSGEGGWEPPPSIRRVVERGGVGEGAAAAGACVRAGVTGGAGVGAGATSGFLSAPAFAMNTFRSYLSRMKRSTVGTESNSSGTL